MSNPLGLIIKIKIIYYLNFRITELQTLHNETQMSLQDTKHALRDFVTRGTDGVESKIVETKEDIKYTINTLR